MKGSYLERRFEMESVEYNALIELVEKQNSTIDRQQKTLEKLMRLVELQKSIIETKNDSIKHLKEMVSLLEE